MLSIHTNIKAWFCILLFLKSARNPLLDVYKRQDKNSNDATNAHYLKKLALLGLDGGVIYMSGGANVSQSAIQNYLAALGIAYAGASPGFSSYPEGDELEKTIKKEEEKYNYIKNSEFRYLIVNSTRREEFINDLKSQAEKIKQSISNNKAHKLYGDEYYNTIMRIIHPVSYTHLDVYKRQTKSVSLVGIRPLHHKLKTLNCVNILFKSQ